MKEESLTVAEFPYDINYLHGDYFIWEEYEKGFTIGFGKKTKSKPVFLEVYSHSCNYLLDAINCPFRYGDEYIKPDDLEGVKTELDDSDEETYKLIFTKDEFSDIKVILTIKRRYDIIDHVEIYDQEKVSLNNKVKKKIDKMNSKMLPEKTEHVRKILKGTKWVRDLDSTLNTKLSNSLLKGEITYYGDSEFNFNNNSFEYIRKMFDNKRIEITRLYYCITKNIKDKYRIDWIDEDYDTGYDYIRLIDGQLHISSKSSMKNYVIYKPLEC